MVLFKLKKWVSINTIVLFKFKKWVSINSMDVFEFKKYHRIYTNGIFKFKKTSKTCFDAVKGCLSIFKFTNEPFNNKNSLSCGLYSFVFSNKSYRFY